MNHRNSHHPVLTALRAPVLAAAMVFALALGPVAAPVIQTASGSGSNHSATAVQTAAPATAFAYADETNQPDATPIPAGATDRVKIHATLDHAGVLHVSERHVLTVAADLRALDFTIHPPFDGTLAVEAVYLAQPGAEAADADAFGMSLPPVSYSTRWADGRGGPGKPAYAFERARNAVHVYPPALQGEGGSGNAAANPSGDASHTRELVVTLDYRVEDAVGVYRDVADLYWRYAQVAGPIFHGPVELEVKLPAPHPFEPKPGVVRAFGHAPGDIAPLIGPDGTVTYRVPELSGDAFAEARIAFPSSWVARPATPVAEQRARSFHLDELLADEAKWVDREGAARQNAFALTALQVAIALALVAVPCLLWWRAHLRRRRPVPATAEDLAALHPAVLGRLVEGDLERPSSLAWGLFALEARGLVRMESLTERHVRFEPGELACVRTGAEPSDPLDDELAGLLFGELSHDHDRLALSDVLAFAGRRPERFTWAVRAWMAHVSAAARAADLFDARAYRAQKWALACAAAAALLALARLFVLPDAPMAALFALAAVAAFATARLIPGPTARGAGLIAELERLWPTDVPANSSADTTSDQAKPEIQREGGRLTPPCFELAERLHPLAADAPVVGAPDTAVVLPPYALFRYEAVGDDPDAAAESDSAATASDSATATPETTRRGRRRLRLYPGLARFDAALRPWRAKDRRPGAAKRASKQRLSFAGRIFERAWEIALQGLDRNPDSRMDGFEGLFRDAGGAPGFAHRSVPGDGLGRPHDGSAHADADEVDDVLDGDPYTSSSASRHGAATAFAHETATGAAAANDPDPRTTTDRGESL